MMMATKGTSHCGSRTSVTVRQGSPMVMRDQVLVVPDALAEAVER